MSGAPWSWLGEILPLDFANTVRRVGMTYREYWVTGADVREWSIRQGDQVPDVSAREAQARLDEVLLARDDAIAVLHALRERRSLPGAAVRRINARVRAHPVVEQLPMGTGPARPRSVHDGTPLDDLLARTAHALVAFAASPEVERLMLCDAPGCGQFYLRDRTDQQWCDPSCGTRARVARHHSRHPAGRPRPQRAETAARRRAR